MIWVRSQNKEKLLKASGFSKQSWGCELYICAIILENQCVIATYSTEEKVVKVMNMLEQFIVENEERKNLGWKYGKENRVVFQMPQDDEVYTDD